MWKILIAQIREYIYYSLISRELLPEEQKGCRRRHRGTVELLYRDQHILNESKTTRKNLAIALIDYKKAYDVVPQSWIIKCLKMYKIVHELSQKPWKPRERNWLQEEEALLKQTSKQVYFKEMHYHRYYS